MALYRQVKFPSTFIEYRSVSEWKGVVVISNFDSLEAAPAHGAISNTQFPFQTCPLHQSFSSTN